MSYVLIVICMPPTQKVFQIYFLTFEVKLHINIYLYKIEEFCWWLIDSVKLIIWFSIRSVLTFIMINEWSTDDNMDLQGNV